MSECYCPLCGIIKCPEEQWGGECFCIDGLCTLCAMEE